MYAYREKNRLLAGFVPATSFAAGSRPIENIGDFNVNMSKIGRINLGTEDYPIYTCDDDFSDRWTHSDLTNILTLIFVRLMKNSPAKNRSKLTVFFIYCALLPFSCLVGFFFYISANIAWNETRPSAGHNVMLLLITVFLPLFISLAICPKSIDSKEDKEDDKP